jgi:endoglucanase
VAYVFHHYEPFLFTHQGAVWQDERYTTAGLRQGLRYPPDAAHDSALPLRKPHPRAAQEMADHLKAGWGPQRLRAEMDRAGRWAREQGVRVLCNEFGCIRAGVDAPSRYRWIHDMRSALEANDIGWTLWDYTDIFGITAQSAQPGQQGRRTLDALAHGALGLLDTAAATAAPARAGAR